MLKPFFSRALKITNCWAMVKMLDTSQYRVRPAGKVQNSPVKIIGISIIIFFCMGSVMVVGDIF